ncbi:DUF4912 domain-containing protein [Nitrosococcus wardiae]|uniref:DUF4912 domain-containing protein n=1 Tax=Nitrosococcus wardiae TaxID=1814290 RepID=A0A4P7BUR2_9GAMM|nr:DUF4912 domain-containing protein [Nitrosococcus wardiae]QBQ53703.1 DUF4912 domain-containing protein [Nitrosococcus wardiae]
MNKENRPFSQQGLLQISQETRDRFFLPPPADRTKVVLMVVNPYCIYAHWSVLKQDLVRARKKLRIKKHTQLVLRFYDLTAGNLAAPASFDVTVPRKADHRYVDLWADDKRYRVELGLANAKSEFVPLAGSNIIETPRASPADPIAPVVFVRHNTQPPLPVKTFPLEFSISLEERATRTQEFITHHFPCLLESPQTQPQENLTSTSVPFSTWSASLPKRSP